MHPDPRDQNNTPWPRAPSVSTQEAMDMKDIVDRYPQFAAAKRIRDEKEVHFRRLCGEADRLMEGCDPGLGLGRLGVYGEVERYVEGLMGGWIGELGGGMDRGGGRGIRMQLESVKGASSTASKNVVSSSENSTLPAPKSLGSVSNSVGPLRGNLISGIQTPSYLGKGQITTQNNPTSSLVTSTMKAASASFLTATVTPSNCRASLVTEAPRSMITRATTKRTQVPSYGVVSFSTSTLNRKEYMSDSRRITIPPFRIALDFPHSSEEGFGGDNDLDDDKSLDDDEDLDDDMPPSKNNTAVPGGPITPREPTSSPSALVPQTRKRVKSAAGLERRKNPKRRKASYATIC